MTGWSEGKGREGKGREGKGREGKGREQPALMLLCWWPWLLSFCSQSNRHSGAAIALE